MFSIEKTIIVVEIIIFVAFVLLMHWCARIIPSSQSYLVTFPQFSGRGRRWEAGNQRNSEAEAGPESGSRPEIVLTIYKEPMEGSQSGSSARPVREKDECSICFSGSEDEKLSLWTVLPKCNHRFHFDCIRIWLEINKTCPLCRDIVQ